MGVLVVRVRWASGLLGGFRVHLMVVYSWFQKRCPVLSRLKSYLNIIIGLFVYLVGFIFAFLKIKFLKETGKKIVSKVAS